MKYQKKLKMVLFRSLILILLLGFYAQIVASFSVNSTNYVTNIDFGSGKAINSSNFFTVLQIGGLTSDRLNSSNYLLTTGWVSTLQTNVTAVVSNVSNVTTPTTGGGVPPSQEVINFSVEPNEIKTLFLNYDFDSEKTLIKSYDLTTNYTITNCATTNLNLLCSFEDNTPTISYDYTNINKLLINVEGNVTFFSNTESYVVTVDSNIINLAYYLPITSNKPFIIQTSKLNFFFRITEGLLKGIVLIPIILIISVGLLFYYIKQNNDVNKKKALFWKRASFITSLLLGVTAVIIMFTVELNGSMIILLLLIWLLLLMIFLLLLRLKN